VSGSGFSDYVPVEVPFEETVAIGCMGLEVDFELGECRDVCGVRSEVSDLWIVVLGSSGVGFYQRDGCLQEGHFHAFFLCF
jgi:hypothetical protein